MAFSTRITVGGADVVLTVPRGTKAWRKANAIFCPAGPAPTRGWFLMTGAGVAAIGGSGGSAGAKTVVWQQFGTNAASLSFPGLYLVNSERIDQGGPGDANALHLLELADARYILDRASGTGAIIKNVRSFANSASYLTGTEGATWATLVQALWEECELLGDFPGLPYTPHGVPENTWLIGLNGWRGLCAVLDQLDCAVKRNSTTGVYSIVQLGGNQTIEDNNATLKWSAESGQYNATSAAANLRIYYRFHRKSYGQERDTELEDNWAYNGAGNWTDLPTNIEGTTGRKDVWDDLPLVLDENNSATNASAITARAEQRRDRYVLRNTVENVHRIHAGLSSAWLPGEQIRATLWRNWDDINNPLGGTVTEFVARSNLITSMQGGDFTAAWIDAELGAPERETYLPPDYGRPTFPNYPRLPNVVQVHHDDEQAGSEVEANGDGLHKGRVARWVNGEMVALDPCWILFVDDYDNAEGDVTAIQNDYYGPARLSGVETSSSSQLPIYLVRKGGGTSGNVVRFRTTSNGYNGVGSAVIRLPSGATYVDGDPIQIIDWYKISLGLRGMFQWSDEMEGIALARGTTASGGIPQYDIIWMEQYSRAAEFTANENMGETNANQFWAIFQDEWMQGLQSGANFVHDDQQRFPDVINGAKGVVLRDEYKDADNPDNPYYKIVSCQRVVIFSEATLVADLEPEDNLAELTDWTPIELGEFVSDPGLNNVNVANGRDLRGFAGDRVLCYRSSNDRIGGKWVFGVLRVDRNERGYVGTTAAAINKGASGNVTRKHAGTLVATGHTDVVKNLCANVAINKTVVYMDIDGIKVMIAAECPMT